jgi:hypothetical protein
MTNTTDTEFQKKVEAIRRGIDRRIDQLKRQLSCWIGQNDSPDDEVPLTNALLEIALDRHVAVHHADGFDLIEAAYRRAVDKWRGSSQ